MRGLRHLGALAGTACVVLAGVVAGGGPASAALGSPRLTATLLRDSNTDTTTTLGLVNILSPTDPDHIAFDRESGIFADFLVRLSSDGSRVDGGVADLRTSLNGTEIDLCSNVPISTRGEGDCRLADQQLPPGSYPLVGHYEGVLGRFNHSDSSPVTFTVDPEPTSVTMTPDVQVFYGEETAGTFGLTVTPRTSGTPSGPVSVSQGGSVLCTATLANGTASCSISADTVLAPGTYPVEGSYSGDGTFDGSQTDEMLTVSPGRAVTSLSLSRASIGFGQQQNEQLTAQVVPVNAGTPAGSVQIMAGDSTVCPDQPLAAGTVTCTLAPGQLSVGSHPLTAVYSGDANFGGTTSAPVTLTVTSPTTTSLTLSSRTIQAGHEAAEHLTVTVHPVITGSGTPTGQVTVKAGTTTLCMITLSNATGSCQLSPTKLRPGTYHLTAHYAATTPFTASTSPPKTLTVTR